jgi:protein-S-isoprenylcysteine O-methyltransferase Ste14
MGVSQLVKRSLVRAFVIFGVLAVVLNVVAAAESFQRDRWSVGLGYFLIPAGLTTALVIHWYATHRQMPYRWRDESWGQERWREDEHDDEAWEDDSDSDSDGWSESSWRR